jgi:hypothetical protein
MDRGKLPAELLPLLRRVVPQPKRRFHLGQEANLHRVTRCCFEVHEIGYRERTGDRLDLAALQIHGIADVRIIRGALRPDGCGQKSAGTAPHNAQSVGRDVILRRVVADESHRPLDVLHDFRDDKLWDPCTTAKTV